MTTEDALSPEELEVLNSVVSDTVIDRIAEQAAREYERATKNGYFVGRPDELHQVLVRIIGGAHVLITRAL